ncbi:MAG: exodeoxyribonuclease VII small subunit [Planctomycetes bacterium]|nr:exodeoxyribonuclease VII small subunit [Planctomycetota bacterium]
MTDKKKKGDEPTYAAASHELERILADIESGDFDLDLLSERVERAAALLAICRQKLATTEAKVKQVAADLAAAVEPQDTDDEAGS